MEDLVGERPKYISGFETKTLVYKIKKLNLSNKR